MGSSTATHDKFKNVKFVGRIPADWDVRKIGDVFDIQLGKMLSKASKTGTCYRPYLGNWNVRWGAFDLNRVEQMDFRNGEFEKFALMPGDVLVCEGGEVGRTAIWDGQIDDCCFQKALHRLRPQTGQVLPHFFMYYMQEAVRQNIFLRYTNESSIAHLTRETLIDVQMPVPPQAEQHVIVETLGAVDAAIERTRAVIDQTRKLKTALLQDLLTNGLPGRQNGHQNVRWLSKAPKAWRVSTLGELVREPIRNGYSPNCPTRPTGRWVLSLSAVSVEGYRLTGVKPAPLNDPKVLDSQLYLGDILVSRSNTRELVGLAGAYDGTPTECSYPDLMMRVRVDDSKANPDFILAVLLSRGSRSYFSQTSRGTSGSMKKIDREILENLPVPLPSPGEQDEIVRINNALGRRVQDENAFIEHAEKLKNALSQALLTGRVRVPTKGGE